ncbi:MAG: adenosylcobalamin-dependent ribonucleoside-diphosphate reductase [Candidatus Aenigmatarchaeota archaeon]
MVEKLALFRFWADLKKEEAFKLFFDRRLDEYKNSGIDFFDYNTFDRENELSEEEIDAITNILFNIGAIDFVKDELAKFYRVNKEDLIEGWFLQNISYQTYENKYQLKKKNSNGELEKVDKTPYHSFVRVALAVALTELRFHKKYTDEEMYNIFSDVFLSYFFMMALGYAFGGGRIMANAGSKLYKTYTSLINCTVMRQIPDSIEGIMETLKEAALSLKSGAGVGYDFSSVRPRGAFVKGAGAETSGVVSFAEIFDKMCSTIMSAGGRRGAQMAVIDIRHPESIEFFSAKRKDGTLRYFNISVLIPNSFIEKLKNDDYFEQWFWEFEGFISEEEFKNRNDIAYVEDQKLPFDYEDYEYFVFSPDHKVMDFEEKREGYYRLYRKKIYNKVKASEVYEIIMKSTYDFAEPGVIFIDNVNRKNPLYKKEYIRTTNPCGEQPLPPYGSCNLGSIMLHRFVKEPFNNTLSWKENFDFAKLYTIAYLMNIFLDGVNDITNLPLEGLRKNAFYKRRHGLGISGLADALVMLGLAYGSEEAGKFFEEVMKTIAFASVKSAIDLSEGKFPAKVGVKLEDWVEERDFDGKKVSTAYTFIKYEHKEFYEVNKEKLLRFSHATSIAPTGTMSLTWGNNVSNGIEPIFSLSYMRNIRLPGKKTKTQEEVFNFAAFLYKKYFGDKEYDRNVFKTTDNITVDEHIYMQAVAQKYVDSAISKTCNIPTDYPFEDFKRAYLKAFEYGLKGFTTFRFNPEVFVGVLVKKDDLESMLIEFELEDGTKVVVKGSDKVIYDGEEHVASNLYEALKEGIYGKM